MFDDLNLKSNDYGPVRRPSFDNGSHVLVDSPFHSLKSDPPSSADEDEARGGDGTQSGQQEEVRTHAFFKYRICLSSVNLNVNVKTFLRCLRNDRYFKDARANIKETHMW